MICVSSLSLCIASTFSTASIIFYNEDTDATFSCVCGVGLVLSLFLGRLAFYDNFNPLIFAERQNYAKMLELVGVAFVFLQFVMISIVIVATTDKWMFGNLILFLALILSNVGTMLAHIYGYFSILIQSDISLRRSDCEVGGK
jgi:hypothetical protein